MTKRKGKNRKKRGNKKKVPTDEEQVAEVSNDEEQVAEVSNDEEHVVEVSNDEEQVVEAAESTSDEPKQNENENDIPSCSHSTSPARFYETVISKLDAIMLEMTELRQSVTKQNDKFDTQQSILSQEVKILRKDNSRKSNEIWRLKKKISHLEQLQENVKSNPTSDNNTSMDCIGSSIVSTESFLSETRGGPTVNPFEVERSDTHAKQAIGAQSKIKVKPKKEPNVGIKNFVPPSSSTSTLLLPDNNIEQIKSEILAEEERLRNLFPVELNEYESLAINIDERDFGFNFNTSNSSPQISPTLSATLLSEPFQFNAPVEAAPVEPCRKVLVGKRRIPSRTSPTREFVDSTRKDVQPSTSKEARHE